MEDCQVQCFEIGIGVQCFEIGIAKTVTFSASDGTRRDFVAFSV